jgi:hypothetical protein
VLSFGVLSFGVSSRATFRPVPNVGWAGIFVHSFKIVVHVAVSLITVNFLTGTSASLALAGGGGGGGAFAGCFTGFGGGTLSPNRSAPKWSDCM